MKTILRAVAGSRAYGLHTPESDYDERGAFVYPTETILGFHSYKETVDSVDPDVCLHEVGKFIRLAANANPNILEMFFMTDYTELSVEGQLLLDNREAFLSQRVRQTYGGYAMAQVKRLMNRQDGSFKSKLRKRREKHARHIARLLFQGEEILQTGTLNVKLSDDKRDEVIRVSKLSDEELISWFETRNEEYMSTSSSLPTNPDYEKINELLLRIRQLNYDKI